MSNISETKNLNEGDKENPGQKKNIVVAENQGRNINCYKETEYSMFSDQPTGNDKYDRHRSIVRDISAYEKQKHERLARIKEEKRNRKGKKQGVNFFDVMMEFCESYNPECKFSWGEFVKKYNFAKDVAVSNLSKYIYNILPKDDTMMKPDNEYFYGKTNKNKYLFFYDFRQKILFRKSYDIVILDMDYSDKFTHDEITNHLADISEKMSELGVNMVFSLYFTDRGIHPYVISATYKRNYYWIDFLRTICDDPYHVAFVYDSGFNTRLSVKENKPYDKVLWVENEQKSLDITPEDEQKFVVDSDLPTFTFKSLYLNKNVEIKYPDEISVIGNVNSIPKSRTSLMVYQFTDYILTDFCKKIDTTKIEKDIYGQFIYPFDNSLDNLRKDLIYLVDYSEKLYAKNPPEYVQYFEED